MAEESWDIPETIGTMPAEAEEGWNTPTGSTAHSAPAPSSDSENLITDEEKQWMDDLLQSCRAKGVTVKDRFELARYAIVFKGDTRKAMDRLSKLREFELANNLDAIDAEEAGKLIDELHPNSLLSCGKDKEGRQVLFADGAAFKPAKMTSDYHWRCMMKAILTTQPLWTPTIKEIREGITMVQKVDSMGLEQFSLSSHKRLGPIFATGAVKIKCLILLNPNLVVRFFTGAAKLCLSRKMAERVQVARSEEELVTHKWIAHDQLAKSAGGGFALSLIEWFEARHRRLEATRKQLGPL